MSRFRFALCYAVQHFLISCGVALVSAMLIYGFFYPWPYSSMLGVGSIFGLVLVVDVACGPLLTLILASPSKRVRERWLDFALVGLVQVLALAYGMYSVWTARPVVLAFERDRLVLVAANEVDMDALPKAPSFAQTLPWRGVVHVGTRLPQNNDEYFQSMELGLAGISPAMRPDWWLPWAEAHEDMAKRVRPLDELLSRRPEASKIIEKAIEKSARSLQELRYLPLTSSKTKDWIALLDNEMQLLAFAPVDGF